MIECYHCNKTVKRTKTTGAVNHETGDRVRICPECVYKQTPAHQISNDL